jgi:hypothetical protein
VAVAALLVVTTAPSRVAGVERVTLTQSSGPVQLPTTPPPAQSATAPATGRGGFRVYLAGDSVGFTLGYYYPKGAVAGMTLGGDPDIGCGLARAAIVLAGAARPVDPKCTTWPDRWRDRAARFRPDISLVVLGGWEVLDHQVDGRTVRPGTPEYERYLGGELQLVDDTLAPASRRIAILNVPCYHQPETGVDATLAETRNQPARGEALNQVLERFVAAHSDRVVLLDLDSFLCPAGRYQDRMQGVRVRYDGVHFSEVGAKLVWRWLGPQLQRLAGQ